MEMPRVEITTTDAKVGTSITRPPMQLRQPPADLKIEQHVMDTVEISTKAAKVNIDQSEAFKDAGLVPPLERSSEFLQKAKQTALEFAAKTMREGEQLKSIDENGGRGSAIAAIAKQNTRLISLETELGYIPESADKVKFEVDPHEISFEVERAEADIQVETNEPEINIPRWEVQHYLEQKPSISFQVVGGQVNRTL
ncbi:DUF6470 family protein [Salibacterium aidingense]|uniref:DUF6470 family protein n=1 Tax=Salibacterium aidingense TaxID=384933 RepID=UPI003BD090C6